MLNWQLFLRVLRSPLSSSRHEVASHFSVTLRYKSLTFKNKECFPKCSNNKSSSVRVSLSIYDFHLIFLCFWLTDGKIRDRTGPNICPRQFDIVIGASNPTPVLIRARFPLPSLHNMTIHKLHSNTTYLRTSFFQCREQPFYL